MTNRAFCTDKGVVSFDFVLKISMTSNTGFRCHHMIGLSFT